MSDMPACDICGMLRSSAKPPSPEEAKILEADGLTVTGQPVCCCCISMRVETAPLNGWLPAPGKKPPYPPMNRCKGCRPPKGEIEEERRYVLFGLDSILGRDSRLDEDEHARLVDLRARLIKGLAGKVAATEIINGILARYDAKGIQWDRSTPQPWWVSR